MHIIRGPRATRILKDQQRHLFKRLLHSSLGRQPLQSWGIRQRRISSKFSRTVADKDPRSCMSSLLVSTSGPAFTSSASDYLIRHTSTTALQPNPEQEPPLSRAPSTSPRHLQKPNRLPTPMVWCCFLHDQLTRIRAHTDDPFQIAKHLGRKVTMPEVKGTRSDLRTVRSLLNRLLHVARGIDIFRVRSELGALQPIAKELAKVAVLLKRNTKNVQVANEQTAKAGEEILRLVRRSEGDGDDKIQSLALIGIGQALTGNLVPALTTMEEVIEIARPAILKAVQQPEGLDPKHHPNAEPISNLLQAVLDCSIDSSLRERLTRQNPLHFDARRWSFLREQMISVRRSLESGSASDELLNASDKLQRFTRTLLSRSLILPFASRSHRHAQDAFDDVISSFTSSTMQDLISYALTLDPVIREQALLAIGFSLVRLGRKYDALSVCLKSDEEGIKLPERFQRKLLREYQREGHMGTIRKLMDILQRRSVDPKTGLVNLEERSYSVVASFCAMRGQVFKLRQLWQRCLEQYPEVDSGVFKHYLLEAYAKSKNVDDFEKYLHENWILPDSSEIPDGTKLAFMDHTLFIVIDAYASLGRTEQAERYLEVLKRPRRKAQDRRSQDSYLLPAHNAVLHRYLRNRDLTKAAEFWSSMVQNGPRPSAYTYELMIKLFTYRGDLRSAFDFLDLMQDEGRKPSAKILNHLLLKLVRAGEYKEAESMFRSMMNNSLTKIDVRTWNCMLESLIRRNSPWETVFSMFKEMKRQGMKPDERTYTMLIVSASEAGLIETAERYFTEADKAGARPGRSYSEDRENQIDPLDVDANDQSDPLDEDANDESLVKDGTPQSSPEGSEPGLRLAPDQRTNISHFSILIHLHLRHGNITAAREYLDELKYRGVRIPALTWNLLVKAYVDRGTEVNIRMAHDLVLGSLGRLPTQLAKGQTEEATESRKRWKQSVQILYAPLLAHSAKKGDEEGMQDILTTFERLGASFSFATMCTVLDCHRQNRDLPKMVPIWNRIFEMATAPMFHAEADTILSTASSLQQQRSSGERPPVQGLEVPSSARLTDIEVKSVRRNALCIPLSIMLSALLREGRHQDIAKLWSDVRSIGFSFDPNNWNQLTRALASANRTEDCLKILENVLNQQLPADEIRRLLVKGNSRSDSMASRRDSDGNDGVPSWDRTTVPPRSDRRMYLRKSSSRQLFWGDLPPRQSRRGEEEGGDPRERDRGLWEYDRWLQARLRQRPAHRDEGGQEDTDTVDPEVFRIFERQNLLDQKRPFWFARPSTLDAIGRALSRQKGKFLRGAFRKVPETDPSQEGSHDVGAHTHAPGDGGSDGDDGDGDGDGDGSGSGSGGDEVPRYKLVPVESPLELLRRYPRAAQILETYEMTQARNVRRRLPHRERARARGYGIAYR